MPPRPVLQLLCDLVALPSVNPMGRPGVEGPPYFEGRVTDYLVDFFRGLGVRHDRIEVAPGRDNLLAYYEAPGGSGRRTLLWDAHQDTVPAEGMTIEPFRPAVADGRVTGRGSCDVKAGLAAMLAAFARLVRERPEGSANVILACTVDEEYTHTGSSALARMTLGADLAIVAEPTMLRVVNAHKGAVRWKVIARGVACHSSTPGLGVNAIYRMARVVGAIEDHARSLGAGRADPVLGPPTLSVGRIEGGQSVNIVPDYAAVELDRRIIPGESTEGVRDRLAGAIRERLGAEVPFEFTEPWVRMPALDPSGSTGWVEPVRAAMAGVLGDRPEVAAVPYGTDAGPLAAAGLPSIVIGPGDIAQAHTKDEWVAVDQVERAVEVYHRLAVSLGEAAPA